MHKRIKLYSFSVGKSKLLLVKSSNSKNIIGELEQRVVIKFFQIFYEAFCQLKHDNYQTAIIKQAYRMYEF